MIELRLPIRTVSLANQREHHMVRYRRSVKERVEVRYALHGKALPAQGAQVTLTREGPRELDDDNLRGAFKSIRDQVAAQFGMDDRDPRLRFEYAQRKAKKFGVVIEIRGAA